MTRNLAINLAGIKIILALLERNNNIDLEDYEKQIKEIAKSLNINKQIQQNNIAKNAKKGRPKENI